MMICKDYQTHIPHLGNFPTGHPSTTNKGATP